MSVRGRLFRRDDRGFTLTELLVTIVIIGVLVAIVMPILLTQRAKAQDAAARTDALTLGKQVSAHFADSPTAPGVSISSGHYRVSGVDIGGVSPGVSLGTVAAVPVATASADITGWTAAAWCLNVINPDGHTRFFKYSAQHGAEPGSCTSTISP